MSAFSEWESFYVIVGSSAGALIGLQFVVLTLLADRPRPRMARQRRVHLADHCSFRRGPAAVGGDERAVGRPRHRRRFVGPDQPGGNRYTLIVMPPHADPTRL